MHAFTDGCALQLAIIAIVCIIKVLPPPPPSKFYPPCLCAMIAYCLYLRTEGSSPLAVESFTTG